jgi:hypothetical protein
VHRLSGEHGFSGTLFTRTDAEDRAGTALSDEEWEKVQSTWAWKKGLQELLCTQGWEVVDDALQDAGIQKEEADG